MSSNHSDLANKYQIVDWDAALGCVNGDRQLLKEIIEAFLDESPRLLKTIRQAIDRQDNKSLLVSAHSLKGSARYFGAKNASDKAFQLESMGRSGQLEHAGDLLAELEQELGKLMPILVNYTSGRIDINE